MSLNCLFIQDPSQSILSDEELGRVKSESGLKVTIIKWADSLSSFTSSDTQIIFAEVSDLTRQQERIKELKAMSCCENLIFLYDSLVISEKEIHSFFEDDDVVLISNKHFNLSFFNHLLAEVIKKREVVEKLNTHGQLKALGEISAQVAHEVNNILHGVSLATDSINRKISQGLDASLLIHKLMKFTARGQLVSRHVLDLAREKGESAVIFDVRLFIDELVALLEISITEKVSLTVESFEESLFIKGHEGQLTQVLMNLVRNAAHATDDCGSVKLSTCYKSNEKILEIYINDDGHGIRAGDIKNIFKPLFTTKDKNHGTGLGLAFVKKVIERHNGDIRVESEVGKGTTFTLSLPVVDSEEQLVIA
jgi:signal transduction histidine kinase